VRSFTYERARSPAEAAAAAAQIRDAFERAWAGERVEVGCAGGLGRTGTVLACMAVLAGVPAADAVEWVRAHYDRHAVETPEQEAWVAWFAEHVTR
jgi:protein-tyrosine phosphatase